MIVVDVTFLINKCLRTNRHIALTVEKCSAIEWKFRRIESDTPALRAGF